MCQVSPPDDISIEPSSVFFIFEGMITGSWMIGKHGSLPPSFQYGGNKNKNSEEPG